MSNPVKIYTDGGFKQRSGKGYAGWGIYVETDKASFSIGGKVTDEKQTNNTGELQGCLEAILVASMLEEDHPEFYLDSRYVMDPLRNGTAKRWAKNNWRKEDGEPVKNVKLWSRILGELQQSGARPKYHWVKGHSGNFGNECADNAASEGVEINYRGEDAYFYQIHKGTLEDVPYTVKRVYKMGSVVEEKKPEQPISQEPQKPAKPEKKAKPKPPSPFLATARLITSTHFKHRATVCGRHVFYGSTYEDKDEIKARNFGKPSAHALMAVSYLKEEIPVLNELMDKVNQTAPKGIHKPVIIGWDKIKSGPKWPKFVDGSIYSEITRDSRNDLIIDDKLLTQYLDKPRLAQEGLEMLNIMQLILQNYIDNIKTNVEYIDCTDYFVQVKDNGKKVTYDIQPTIDETKPLIIGKGKDAIRLIIGHDSPDRNAIKRIITADKTTAAQFILVKTNITTKSFRHYLIVEADGEIGIFGNPYANVVFTV